MSNNFMSYENALEVLTPYAEAIKAAGSFSALIIITAATGQTVTVSKGGDTYTAVETSSGTYEVSVDSMGTWTVTDGTNTDTVTVSQQTTYYVTLSSVPDGKTVLPTDDVSIWLACGGRSEAYTTLSEVLNDSVCLSSLIADSNAVDYLARSTTWASTVCANQSAMSLIGLNNYCANTLLADSTWRPAICNSAYFEKVLNVKVPKMTGNTTPSGECFVLNAYGDQSAFVAFDESSSSVIVASNYTSVIGWYVGYYFDEDVTIYKTHYYISQTEGRTENISITIQATKSKDNPVWEDLTDATSKTIGSLDEDILSTKNIDEYIGFRFYTYGRGVRVMDIQFYGRRDV